MMWLALLLAFSDRCALLSHDAGLPVTFADPASVQWQLVWRLWAKYFTSGQRCYDYADRASRMFPWPDQQE